MIPGAGWISVGPGYRRWYAKDRVFVDASAAVSWRGYKTAQARFELPTVARSRLALGSQVGLNDFTQVNYFGEGPEHAKQSKRDTRIRSQNLAGYVTVKPAEWAGIGAQIGWLRPSILPRAGWFESDRPDTRQMFASNPVFPIGDQPTFLQREVSVTADTRDFPRPPDARRIVSGRRGQLTGSDDCSASGGTRSRGRTSSRSPSRCGRRPSRVARCVRHQRRADRAVLSAAEPRRPQHAAQLPDYRFHDRNMAGDQRRSTRRDDGARRRRRLP